MLGAGRARTTRNRPRYSLVPRNIFLPSGRLGLLEHVYRWGWESEISCLGREICSIEVPEWSTRTCKDGVVLSKSRHLPFSSYEKLEAFIYESPDEHVVLVHSARSWSRQRLLGIRHDTHRRRSMPLHSLTVVIQKPLRKLSDEGTLEIVKTSSESSCARACCTKGLSDIQKPAISGESTMISRGFKNDLQ
jgi:hypothetical protein